MSLNNSNITTIGNMEYAYTSLYELEYLPASGDTTDFNTMCKFNAVSVNFGSDTILLDRDNVTKLFKLKQSGESYQRVSTVTINFRETSDFKVRGFFESWQNSFYNKEGDFYYSADPRKSFKLSLLDGYGNVKKSYNLNNIVPQNIGSLNLTWGNNPQVITYTIAFYVERIS